MALRDYESLDEDDFYGQGFEREGVVSIWIGTTDPKAFKPKTDTLQDLCGVGYYSLDNQEVVVEEKPTDLEELLSPISYSSSFIEAAVKAAEGKVEKGLWAVAQFDFAYDPGRVKRKIQAEPRFIGFFKWDDEEDEE